MVDYNVSLSEKGKKNLEKAGKSSKAAANGTFYLPKGVYTVTVTVAGSRANQSFEVK